MSVSTKTRVVDWNEILAPHGEDTKATILGILDEYNIDYDAPEAALIASMVISQVETLTAFLSIESKLEDGKDALSDQFTEQILALRGIISYAKEHLVETSKETIEAHQKTIEARQEKMLDVVSTGIRKSVLKASVANNNRSLIQSVAGAIAGGVIAIVSGGICLWVGTSMFSQSAQPVTANSEFGQIGIDNAEIIESCIANSVELNGKCVITVE